jgi:hypothetical protein
MRSPTLHLNQLLNLLSGGLGSSGKCRESVHVHAFPIPAHRGGTTAPLLGGPKPRSHKHPSIATMQHCWVSMIIRVIRLRFISNRL